MRGSSTRSSRPSRSASAPGSGSSICHRIVHSHRRRDHGRERGSASGTTFRVIAARVRRADARAAGDRAAAAAAATARGSLLVDDEPRSAARSQPLLAPEHDVVAVTRARDALHPLASGERFDVILCDLMMPEMTGMELYDELATARPELRGADGVHDRRRVHPRRASSSRGSTAPLEKPFAEAQLRRAIERIALPSQGS